VGVLLGDDERSGDDTVYRTIRLYVFTRFAALYDTQEMRRAHRSILLYVTRRVNFHGESCEEYLVCIPTAKRLGNELYQLLLDVDPKPFCMDTS
jgi:hypothetical protein